MINFEEIILIMGNVNYFEELLLLFYMMTCLNHIILYDLNYLKIFEIIKN